jgi:[ribosomal protein S18]-alanine N-acetyltransferase
MIRPATLADLDAIDEIERHSFKAPWPRASFESELSRDWARIDVAVDDRVIGFCNYWLVANEVHILAIATRPDRRRAGIGGHLLAHALDRGRDVHCTLATLEVRRGNVPAIAMYERAGFRTVHVRERYYQDDGEDALVMLAELTGSHP